jgi:hypothetical protein
MPNKRHKSPRPNQKQQQDKSTSSDGQATGSSYPRDYPLVPLTDEIKHLEEAYGSTQQNNSIQQNKQLTTQRILCFITFLGFVAAAVYAGINYRQWKDLRHNFEVDQRAWLKAEVQFPEAIMTSARLPIRVYNLGKNVVTSSVMLTVIEYIPSDESPSFSPTKTYSSTHVTFPLIFPTEYTDFEAISRNTDLSIRIFTGPQIEDLRRGKSYIVVFGQIAYKDQFGKHWTRFCDWRDYTTEVNGPRPGFAAQPCTVWNMVGDGDPPKQTS